MTLVFFKNLLERVIKTFAQTLLGVLGVGVTNLMSVPWQAALITAGTAALLSMIMSIASAPWGDPDTPSLVVPAPKATGAVEGEPSE